MRLAQELLESSPDSLDSSPTRLGAFLSTPLHINGLALVASSGVSSLLGVVYWALVARIADPATLGLNAALVSAMVAVSTFSQLGLPGALLTYVPRQRDKAGRLVVLAYLGSAGISLLLAAGFVALAPHTSASWHGLSSLPIAAMFTISVAAWSVYSLQGNVLTGLRKAVWVPIVNIAYSAGKLGLVIIFLGLFGGYGIFVSWVLPAAVCIVPVSVLVFRRFIPRARVSERGSELVAKTMTMPRFIAADSIGMLLAGLSTILLPVIVVTRAGPRAGALFYIPWILAQSLDLLSGSFGMSLTTEGSRDVEGARRMANRLLSLLLPTVAFLALLGILASPYMLNVFGSEYVDSSVAVLRWLLIGSVFRTVTVIAICTARAELAASRIVLLQFVLAAIVPATAWFLTPLYGVQFAAIGWVAGQALTAAVAMISVRRMSQRAGR